jgi:D-alanyl-D-alanine dipeptidase
VPDAPAACPTTNPVPAGWVDLATIPNLREHIGYATPDNFTGAVLPGYGAAAAWMLAAPAAALQKVEEDLAPRGLALLVFDAYRPARASRAMVDWARRTNQLQLFADGYIASKSGHNHGHTVDLTLYDLATGEPVDMGTPWDTLNVTANTENATGDALTHRHWLKDAMKARGFRPYSKEWWHFGYTMEDTAPRDVPYGACESPEPG